MPPNTLMIQRREKGASELNRAGEKKTDRQQRKERIDSREHMKSEKEIRGRNRSRTNPAKENTENEL